MHPTTDKPIHQTIAYPEIIFGEKKTANQRKMSAKLCIAFRRKDKYEEATLRNRQELHHIMELFDSMFPTAPKRVVVDSENDEYHERWIGDQFYILFCMNEVTMKQLLEYKINHHSNKTQTGHGARGMEQFCRTGLDLQMPPPR